MLIFIWNPISGPTYIHVVLRVTVINVINIANSNRTYFTAELINTLLVGSTGTRDDATAPPRKKLKNYE